MGVVHLFLLHLNINGKGRQTAFYAHAYVRMIIRMLVQAVPVWSAYELARARGLLRNSPVVTQTLTTRPLISSMIYIHFLAYVFILTF